MNKKESLEILQKCLDKLKEMPDSVFETDTNEVIENKKNSQKDEQEDTFTVIGTSEDLKIFQDYIKSCKEGFNGSFEDYKKYYKHLEQD